MATEAQEFEEELTQYNVSLSALEAGFVLGCLILNEIHHPDNTEFIRQITNKIKKSIKEKDERLNSNI